MYLIKSKLEKTENENIKDRINNIKTNNLQSSWSNSCRMRNIEKLQDLSNHSGVSSVKAVVLLCDSHL